jgi:hypothetical protein
MLPDTHIKERLSLSYIMAISANAGLSCQSIDEDFGMDGSICEVRYNLKRKAYRYSSFGLDFQLKATVNAIPKSGFFIYDLEVKNYLDLIDEEVGRERILILYILPKNRDKWVNVGKSETRLEKAAYWCSLRGYPEVNNKAKVRIKIPESQQLTTDSLNNLFMKIKGGCSL